MKNTEIIYLKRNQSYNPYSIQSAVKITNNKALHCYNNAIEVDGLAGDDTSYYFIEFYLGLGYQEGTKEEFDKLFIEATGYINELSKI